MLCFSKRLSASVEDTQSVKTTKGNDECNFVNSLRSLFPSVEIKVEHVSFFFKFISFPNVTTDAFYREESQLDIVHCRTAYRYVSVQ